MAKLTKTQKTFRKIMSQFMVSAWAMARKAAVKFGGKASQYFTESLRIVWENFARQISLF